MAKRFLPYIDDLYTEQEWDEIMQRIRKSAEESNEDVYFVSIDNRIRKCLEAEFPVGNWVEPWLILYRELLEDIQLHRKASKSPLNFVISARLLEQGIRRMELFLEFWDKIKPPEEPSSRG